MPLSLGTLVMRDSLCPSSLVLPQPDAVLIPPGRLVAGLAAVPAARLMTPLFPRLSALRACAEDTCQMVFM
jgi:hypothetical protein